MKTINFVSNFYAIPENKYNKAFLAMAVRYLSENFGSNQQFVICQLVESGLKNHPQYSSCAGEIERLWKAHLAERGEAGGSKK